MEFPSIPNNSIGGESNETISFLKDDDSPQQQINEQSITEDLQRTRDSLKRKLQTRRSYQELVNVGIMPPQKAPLPFYEQRKQLQMRKTRDMLKNKISSRPDRQLLIEHNILSDTTAAPAIQKTQRQLKRARLADDLNDKIAARPGVLELVASNILEIEPTLKEAIRGGQIKFPSTKSTASPTRAPPPPPPPMIEEPPVSLVQIQRPLRPKTSSVSTSTTTTSTIHPTAPATKRTSNSTPKVKSSLTFHEYKGPSQKVEVTKVPLQPAPSLIVQPVQATLVPLVPLEAHPNMNEDHYRVQLLQQQLYLELVQNNNGPGSSTGNSNGAKLTDAEESNDSSQSNHDDNPIGNLLKQPIDETVNLLPNLQEEIQSFEKMKLADLKNQCRKYRLSTSGRKTELIEKLRQVRGKMSDTSAVPTVNNRIEYSPPSSTLKPSSSSVQLLMSASSLADQELYQKQQQKIVELENQLEKLKQLDAFALQTSQIFSQFDQNPVVPPKCNPMVSVQIQKRILMQEQEKLKQKIHEDQQYQQQQQQHSIVPLTPESVAQFLARQNQNPQVSDEHSWSMHHSFSAPSFLSFADGRFPSNEPTNIPDLATAVAPLVDDDTPLFNLLDGYVDPTCTLHFPTDHSVNHSLQPGVLPSPSAHMDWLSMSSPSIGTDLYDDNNPDFTQFLNQFGNEHHLLFDAPLSTCQQSSNTLSFDLLSPSSPMM